MVDLILNFQTFRVGTNILELDFIFVQIKNEPHYA